MPNAEVIRAQTTPEDGALFTVGLENSKFKPLAPIAFTEDLRQKGEQEIPDIRLGTQVIIPFEKTCTLLEDVEFEFLPPALVGAGGATYIRYADFLAYALIAGIKWSFTSNTLQTYHMDMEWSDLQFMTDEQRANEEQLVGGNLSAAARNTYATAPYKLRVRIPTPWKDQRCHAPAISALTSKLTLTIDFNPAAYVVQTDGTKPATLTLTQCKAVYQQIHTTGHTRQEFTALQSGKRGISYLYDDKNRVEFDIPANYFTNAGNSFVFTLNELDGPIHKINGIIRTQAQLDPTNANTGAYEIDTTYLEGLSYRIVSNGMDIQDPENHDLDGVRKIQKFYHCKYDTQQFTCLWSEFPEMHNVASGSVSFGNFNNPRLFLSNPSLNGNHPALRVTLIYPRYNWLVQQRGVIQRVWR